MDSVASDCSSGNGIENEDDDQWIKPIKPPMPLTRDPPSLEEAKAKATRSCMTRQSRDLLWDNGYFYIAKGLLGVNGVRVHCCNRSIGADSLNKF